MARKIMGALGVSRGRFFVAAGLGLGLAACASRGPSPRSLHYQGEVLVYSQPGDSRAYAAYLRARIALEGQPADLTAAAAEIGKALSLDDQEPHLWTTLAEVELRRGDRQAAREASETALRLRPEYGPARQLLARLEAGETGEGATSASTRRPEDSSASP